MTDISVTFLCGSLEPGRDGVGDYTRLFAREIIRQGGAAHLIALNDGHIAHVEEYFENIGGIKMDILRLPSNLSNGTRLKKAHEWMDSHPTAFLNLQYVPYSFHDKGLPFLFMRRLTALGPHKNWQIMFHELWIGMDSNSSFMNKAIGFFQKQIVKMTVKSLNPTVFTQTNLYKELLHRIGIQAQHLALFSNIPIVDRIFSGESSNKLKKKTMVLFGGIHSSNVLNDFAKEIVAYELKHKVKISLITIGRNGEELKHWMATWNSLGLYVENMGEKPAEVVSEVLKKADFGIITTPFILAEKSGSAAAMLAHQLPVICVAKPWSVKNFQSDASQIIWEYKKGNFENFLLSEPKVSYTNYINVVVQKYINTINKAIVNGKS